MNIFFRIESLYFPGQLEEELDEVDSRDGAIDKQGFFLNIRVACEEAVFDGGKKDIINF